MRSYRKRQMECRQLSYAEQTKEGTSAHPTAPSRVRAPIEQLSRLGTHLLKYGPRTGDVRKSNCGIYGSSTGGVFACGLSDELLRAAPHFRILVSPKVVVLVPSRQPGRRKARLPRVVSTSLVHDHHALFLHQSCTPLR